MTYKHSCETLKWRNEKGSYFKLVNIYDGWWELTIVLNGNTKVAINVNFCPFCGVKFDIDDLCRECVIKLKKVLRIE